MKFPEKAWWHAYAQTLNDDPAWSEAVQYFEGRIEFRHDNGCGRINIVSGMAVVATDQASPMGADIIIKAPDREWARLLNGETDWFRGMSPGLGEFSMEGNVVAAMRNVKAMAFGLNAMARVGKPAPLPVEPSPSGVRSGKPTKCGYVVIDGLRVYYEEAGEGQPIVCFHAASQDTLMWRNVLDGLSDQYRVISLDAPGHCKTEEPTNGPFTSLTQHAEFNEKFMEKLGLVKPAVMGCSMGGNLVLELGARRPDFYAAIISAEGADYTPTVSQFVLDMLLVNGQELIECWARSLTGNRTPPERAKDVRWQIRRATPQIMCADLTGYGNFDRRDMVGKIKAPVLMLRGDADWLVNQELVEATKSRIPGAKIVVMEGTGHYPMTENPYEFCEHVREFLRTAGVK